MKHIIHVNRHRLQANAKHQRHDPAITVKTYKSNDYGHQVLIKDAAGNVIARVLQQEEKPLSCGAKVWIETEYPVEVLK